MRAVVIPQFGDFQVLALKDVAIPDPGPYEITIDVAYAGVNYAEVLFRKGVVSNLPLPFVPGIEVSGTIRALGERVTGFRVGQLVAALSIGEGGGYAEVVKVPSQFVFPLDEVKESALDLAAAAAFPSNVTTAYLIVSEVSRMRQGETVLVHAAAGGVGSALGQIARKLGAGCVMGTVCSKDKIEYAKSLGYDAVFLRDGHEQSVMELTRGQGVDIVVDPVGGSMRKTALQVLKPFGRLVAMGNASDAEDVQQSINELWFTSKAVLGFNLQQMSVYAPDLISEAARKALSLVVRGDIRVDVTDILELQEAGEAHRRIEERITTGKLVLKVRQ
ncbi:zinc-binding alcohol dehydrogenase family protein [Paenibacillus sp. SI8]|uniref:quinone oxidoreductase family protein n=1 Tax=unclassified Paenibacillus TaxID=185978 RepID=UPI0034677893